MSNQAVGRVRRSAFRFPVGIIEYKETGMKYKKGRAEIASNRNSRRCTEFSTILYSYIRYWCYDTLYYQPDQEGPAPSVDKNSKCDCAGTMRC